MMNLKKVGIISLCALTLTGCGKVLKLSNITFDGANDSGIMFNDPDIGIKWPFEEIGGMDNLIIAEKDKRLQTFKEYFAHGCK